jgi:hypothetical protein
VVAGVGSPAASAQVTTSTTLIAEGEQRPFPHSPSLSHSAQTVDTETRNPSTSSGQALEPEIPEGDDDEEVSWQSAARASLDKNKPLNVKPSSPPPTRKVELAPQKVAVRAESPSASQQKSSSEVKVEQVVKTQTTSSPLPSSSPLPESPQPQTPASTDLPEDAQFTREELPADFWRGDPEPPPASSDYSDDEVFETATSAPVSKARVTPKSTMQLPFDMPLFNELQALFPGRIVRIDAKQQKQAEEEGAGPTNEATSVLESEESE